MPTEVSRRPRRKQLIGHRRRVEDEEEGGHDTLELDDDSLTEGSGGSDDHDAGNDSDTSNVDDGSPTSPTVRKRSKSAETTRKTESIIPKQPVTTDTDIMLNGLSISDQSGPVQEMNFDDVNENKAGEVAAPETAVKLTSPLIVSSGSAAPSQPQAERRRQEHDEYRRKRDEDPAFVPNRGRFFMHDHRHAGPAANGFRPFGRGGGARGRGRGGLYAGYQGIPPVANPSDPLTNAPWAHDMHEAVASPPPPRGGRYPLRNDGPPSTSGSIPVCPPSQTPINRTMGTEKNLGAVQVRVFFPGLKEPISMGGLRMKQYTKLPDHRPPLRRDKPVRISLPEREPRYIYPAVDRSFIFIPRALRPNQQKLRGRARSGLGSIGGWSRRTSVFGGSHYGGAGSYYGGSTYSPSVAMSRRSSIAPDLGQDFLGISPTGSAISRPPMPVDNTRPVVRLPPQAQPLPTAPVSAASAEASAAGTQINLEATVLAESSSINDLPQPQTHPLPQKPAFHENRPSSLPMHQPRPQKTVSVENIESPVQQQYQQAFHQQFPVQVSNGYSTETHARHPSYPSQHSTGTPLSQIPERAIHAAPFQPNTFQQQAYYGQPYPVMPPQQQGYYYPSAYPGAAHPNAGAPAFVPGPQAAQSGGYSQQQQQQTDPSGAQNNGQGMPGPNLVAQELNGMVYYYDPNQLPAVPSYAPYPPAPAYAPAVMNMGGMVTPSPDTFYYPQPPAGMPVVYYQG